MNTDIETFANGLTNLVTAKFLTQDQATQLLRDWLKLGQKNGIYTVKDKVQSDPPPET